MKTFITKLPIIFVFIILLAVDVSAKEYRLDIDFVVFGTLTSNHFNDINDAANEKNGGSGIQIGIGGTIDISVFYIDLINSHGDRGAAYGIEAGKVEPVIGPFRFEMAMWIMKIEGYKNDDGTAKVVSATWPKFEFGINPFWFTNYDYDIYINYNYMNFITVEVKWFSIGYSYKFKGVVK